jgi:predicted ATPase
MPLELMLRCLGVDPHARPVGHSPEALLRAMTDLLELIEKLCARSPLVLVIDDIQYADEASVLFWHRLRGATTRLPLLIVAAARPTPSRPDVTQARQVMEQQPGAVLRLRPVAD